MKIFASYSNSEESFSQSLELVNKFGVEDKPILYIPFAAEKNKYEDMQKNAIKNLKSLHYTIVDAVSDGKEILEKDLTLYGMIYFDDGNPFRLLKELKESGAYKYIEEYMNIDGIVFGKGAGAQILGASILPSAINNSVITNSFKDYKGYKLFNDYSVYCYTPEISRDELRAEFVSLQNISKKYELPISALSNNAMLYRINDNYYKTNPAASAEFIKGNTYSISYADGAIKL